MMVMKGLTCPTCPDHSPLLREVKEGTQVLSEAETMDFFGSLLPLLAQLGFLDSSSPLA